MLMSQEAATEENLQNSNEEENTLPSPIASEQAQQLLSDVWGEAAAASANNFGAADDLLSSTLRYSTTPSSVDLVDSVKAARARRSLDGNAECYRSEDQEEDQLLPTSFDSLVKTEMVPLSSPSAALSQHQSPRKAKKLPGLASSIPPVTEALFVHKPLGFPRTPPPIVHDRFYHGQLVWWNRFLANRKKSRGLNSGFHVGRVVDFDCEWFPIVDLADIKKRLKCQAQQLGRRSVFVLSMDDLRYLAVPPRAITIFPDPDPAKQRLMMEGCKAHNPISYRGLLRSQMIDVLRKVVGDANTLLETELINVFFHSQGDDASCSEDEIAFLENTNVWEVLRSRQTRPSDTAITEEQFVQQSTSKILPEKKILSSSGGGALPVKQTSRARRDAPPSGDVNRSRGKSSSPRGSMKGSVQVKRGKGRPRKDKGDLATSRERVKPLPIKDEDELEDYPLSPSADPAPSAGDAPQRVKRRRKASMIEDEHDMVYTSFGPPRKRHHSGEIMEIARWIELCQRLCLTRKQVQHMLRGIPSILLLSSTGVPWPQDVLKTSVSILKAYLNLSKSSEQDVCPDGIANLVADHICAANLFLYLLSKTLVVRIPIKRLTEVPVEAPAPVQPPPVMNFTEDQPMGGDSTGMADGTATAIPPQPLQEDSTEKVVQAPQQVYDIAFCADYGHVNMPKSPPRSVELIDEPVASPYNCHEPFLCVSYHLGPWASLFRLDENQQRVVKPRGSPTESPGLQNGDRALPETDELLPLTEEGREEFLAPALEAAGMATAGMATAGMATATTEMTAAAKVDSGKPEEEGTKKYPNVKCAKSTLLLVGSGTVISKPSSYCIKLNQISSKKPTPEELESAARTLLESGDEAFSIAEMERRLNRLLDLKDAAARLRSIFEEETTSLYRSDSKMNAVNVRYFESQWAELLKKLKNRCQMMGQQV